MRLLDKAQSLVKWLVVLAILVVAVIFCNSQHGKWVEEKTVEAESLIEYEPYNVPKIDPVTRQPNSRYNAKYENMPYTYYPDGHGGGWDRYKSVEDFVSHHYFDYWAILRIADIIAMVIVGFKAFKEYQKVSGFISEQAKLEEQKEKAEPIKTEKETTT